MELRTIFDLPNLYPEDKDTLLAYVQNNESITYTGKFEKNQVTFTDIPIEEIEVFSGVNFQFIVQFSDNTLYTSPSFFDKIGEARNNVNPYINQNTIPIIKFNDNLLSNYSKKEIFDISEQYAEVEITDTLDTKEDYLRHIDYLTTSDSGNSPLKNANEMGSWEVKLTDELGMDHQKQLDDIESKEEDFSEDEPGVDIVETDSNNVTGGSSGVEEVTQLYPPFGFRGRGGFGGGRDRRRLGPDGFYYRWDKNSNSWIKRD